jgi:hypothetical protein
MLLGVLLGWWTYGSNDTGAVGADHAGLVLGLEHVCDADHVWRGQLYSFQRLIRRVIPCWGMPSVMLFPVSFCRRCKTRSTYVTIRGTSALMASSILAAATGGLRCGQFVCPSSGCRGSSIRDEDARGSSSRRLHGLLDIGEDGQTKVLCAGLLGVCSTDDLCACGCASIRGSVKYQPCVRMGAYRTRSPAARGNWWCVSGGHLSRAASSVLTFPACR